MEYPGPGKTLRANVFEVYALIAMPKRPARIPDRRACPGLSIVTFVSSRKIAVKSSVCILSPNGLKRPLPVLPENLGQVIDMTYALLS